MMECENRDGNLVYDGEPGSEYGLCLGCGEEANLERWMELVYDLMVEENRI